MPPPLVKWRVACPDPGIVALVEQGAGLTGIVATLLVNRGVTTPDDAAAFLDPRLARLHDPGRMADMDRAVRRTVDAISRGERICVYGDYDADGLTAAALLADFLAACGRPVEVFVPERMRDGYGLNGDRLAGIVRSGATLIIAVDCGARSIDEAALVRSLGADLIVLDHHEPGPVLPEAVAVVNPRRPDCRFPFKDLAAVGIAFFFAGAVRRSLAELGRLARDGLDIRDYLDLVAVGTIADVVPLLGDNRVLAAAGLRALNERPRPGLAALKAVAGIAGRTVRAGNVSFLIAPRINAAGRLGDPMNGLRLLMARDPEESARFAGILDRENDERRRVEADVLDLAGRQVLERPERKTIVVWGDGWHPGVVGIVASRLVETFHRPAVVVGVVDGLGRGSARSIAGFDIGRALGQVATLLVRSGGHRMAAGLAVEPGLLPEFAEEFERVAAAALDDETLTPVLRIDAEIPLKEAGAELAGRLASLAPHGIGNPEPVFMASNVTVCESRRFGTEQAHVAMVLEQGGIRSRAIRWRFAGPAPATGTVLDVAFSLEIDEKYGGGRLVVKDTRSA